MHNRTIGGVVCALALACVVLGYPGAADAFCGFYATGADSEAFNNATQVALMRHGTRTVVTMQNNYLGPARGFAMVVPVPVVLNPDDIKVVDEAIFETMDKLTAPRAVEYWDVDPCSPAPASHPGQTAFGGQAGASDEPPPVQPQAKQPEARVEASFKEGEYNISILSAGDSAELERWLEARELPVPEGGRRHLDSYIAQGMFFMVATVDPERVRYSEQRAVLSPLRFHYDSPDFSLPIRLGLINADRQQDLVVYVLALNDRYEVVNRPNVAIPTNVEVREQALEVFPRFYSALFEKTLEVNPGAVVTEYAWGANSCDPCPAPVMGEGDLLSLGARAANADPKATNWVISRMHARYGAEDLDEDLVFQVAEPLIGGTTLQGGQGSYKGSFNTFQGRYLVRHQQRGTLQCARYRAAMTGLEQSSFLRVAPTPNTEGRDLDYYTSLDGIRLESLIDEDVPEVGLLSAQGLGALLGCSALPHQPQEDPLSWLALTALAALFWSRKKPS